MRHEISALDIERFYSKIKFNEETSCWDWKGTMFSNGYGAFKLKRKMWRSHRLSYSIFVGEIPSKHEIHHTCENRKCCNPEHLQLLKHPEHARTHNIKKTHCKRGHEFTKENTRISPTNKRICRKCERINHYNAYHKDIEKARAYVKKQAKLYRQKNPEKMKDYDRKRYKKRKLLK